jgi:hypothetical protein
MMTRRTALSIAIPLCAGGAQRKNIEIRGMYSHPKAFWDTGARLDEYGVNALFVHAGSINTALMQRAASEGARVFAEFPTLNGKGYVENHPEAWPVDQHGRRAEPATWFMGVCPTEPRFREWRMKQLNDLLERHQLAGVWMDYFHWHAQFEEPQPVLPETCFSPTCIATFERVSGIRVPQGTTAERAQFILQQHDREWRSWRTRHLVAWAREIKAVVQKKQPQALLGVYHCPWTDSEYNGARGRILGLDLTELAAVVDVFSPMVYHGRMGRPAAWVGEHVEWLSGKIGQRAKIWPIVQAHNEPRTIPAGEFEQVLKLGVSGRATGVMMFTAQAVASDRAKMQVLRRVYAGWQPD